MRQAVYDDNSRDLVLLLQYRINNTFYFLASSLQDKCFPTVQQMQTFLRYRTDFLRQVHQLEFSLY